MGPTTVRRTVAWSLVFRTFETPRSKDDSVFFHFTGRRSQPFLRLPLPKTSAHLTLRTSTGHDFFFLNICIGFFARGKSLVCVCKNDTIELLELNLEIEKIETMGPKLERPFYYHSPATSPPPAHILIQFNISRAKENEVEEKTIKMKRMTIWEIRVSLDINLLLSRNYLFIINLI